jgi:hypothetical protein
MDPTATTRDSSARKHEFWSAVWLGTTLAGPIIALVVCRGHVSFEGLVHGVIVGASCAALAAAPGVGTAAMVCWSFWMWRFRLLWAVIGGAVSGVLMGCVFVPAIPPAHMVFLWAGVAGAVGGGVAGMIHDKLYATAGAPEEVSGGTWQFSLRDLFLRIAVLAVTLSVWIGIIRFFRSLPEL